jgi:hypothetical protein
MKFPSLTYIGTEALASFKRFFLPLVFAFIGTYASILLAEYRFNAEHHFFDTEFLGRVVHTCMLGLPFSLGCMLYIERSDKAFLKWLLPASVLILMMAYGVYMAPARYFSDLRLTIIFFVFIIVMHLWVAIAPYIHADERQGFWRFNEILFTRIFTAVLFSVVLYAGLTLAMLSCKMLLKIDIDGKRYLELWELIAGVFNTWFFLSGIPTDYEELNSEKVFPKGLKIFTQYILIPLVSVYMLILYAYGIKILFLWKLPIGWVSMPILWYAEVGILAVLLVYPLRNDEQNAWVRFFARFFFTATLPLILLLYIATWTRIDTYGITEKRYYLLIVGTWLACISVYYIFSKQKNIRYIPVSLALIGALSWFGPWGAFAVSQRSQLHRLETLLIRNKIWKPGEKITDAVTTWNPDDENKMRAIIDYLVDRNDVMALKYLFNPNLFNLNIINLDNYYQRQKANSFDYNNNYYGKEQLKNNLMAMLINKKPSMDVFGKTPSYVPPKNPVSKGFYRAVDNKYGINIGGYNKVYNFHYNHPSDNKSSFKQWINISDKDSLEVKRDSINANCLDFYRKNKIAEKADFKDLIKKLMAKYGSNGDRLPYTEVMLDAKGEFNMRFVMKYIRIEGPVDFTDSTEITDLDGLILIR